MVFAAGAAPADAGSPDPGQLAETLCVEVERVVARDNTVAYDGLRLQLPKSPVRVHFVKATVKVRHYPDGSLAVFHRPRRLARYDAGGTIEGEINRAAA